MAARPTDPESTPPYILVLDGKRAGERIPVTFAPTEYGVETGVTYGEQKLPGFATPITQFASGNGETLSVDLLFDTYEEGTDVRETYTDRIDALLDVDGSLHAPPRCKFVWGSLVDFESVVESANKSFTMFRADGIPVRARVSLTFRRYETPDWQRSEEPRESADRTTTWTVTEGDTLWRIAAAEYDDPRLWRPIAKENGIENPRALEAGTELIVPPLEA